MTETAHRIMRMAARHCAAWTRADTSAILEVFAEHGEISVNGGAPHRGRAEIAANAAELLATFPGLTVRAIDTRSAGTRAVFLWVLEGRHGETGHEVVLPGWHEWELDDDLKVRRCRGFFDADDLARQIAGDGPA